MLIKSVEPIVVLECRKLLVERTWTRSRTSRVRDEFAANSGPSLVEQPKWLLAIATVGPRDPAPVLTEGGTEAG